jgi:hypothetical protein
LECSEYADEYFVDSSSHIKKYARLAWYVLVAWYKVTQSTMRINIE